MTTAMILAAGRGERMYPLTEHLPKPLLDFRGKPLIAHVIDRCIQAGITRIVINVCHFAEKIVSTVNALYAEQISLHYSYETIPLNMAGGVNQALPLLGQDPFLIMSADIITDYPLKNLIEKTPSVQKAHLILVDNPSFHPEGDFALNPGGILSLEGNPKWNYAGMGLYRPEVFEKLPPGMCSMRTALAPHLSQGMITGEYYSGIWYNLGTPQDYDSFLKAMAI